MLVSVDVVVHSLKKKMRLIAGREPCSGVAVSASETDFRGQRGNSNKSTGLPKAAYPRSQVKFLDPVLRRC